MTPDWNPYDDTITEQQREVQEALRSMPEFDSLLNDRPEDEPEDLKK